MQTKSTIDSFRYRDLQEDYVENIQPKDISGLFGLWTITSIAKTGGTLQKENTIQQQIGHKLYLDKNILRFDFFNDSLEIKNPIYKIVNLDVKNYSNLKGTSYFSGYRMCRNNVIILKCSESVYFEVIHFQEMTYYYDGRIYFLSKDQ